MGCCQTAQFVPNDQIPGQGVEASEIFDMLELTARQVNELYSVFLKIDADGGGTILSDELYFFIQKDRNILLDTVFSVFDDDKSGQLDFIEFVCSLWCLLTLNTKNLGGFAFILCDVDDSGDVSMYEISKMFEILYPAGGSNAIIMDLKNDVDFNGSLNISEFLKWTQKKPNALSPLLRLHQLLSEFFCGMDFWRILSEKRVKLADHSLRGPKCLSLLRKRVREVKGKYDMLRKVAEDAKLRKIRDSAAKGTVAAAKVFNAYMTAKAVGPRPAPEIYPPSPLLATQTVSALAHNYQAPLRPAYYKGVNPYREKQYELQVQTSEKQKLKESIKAARAEERAKSGKFPRVYVSVPMDDHDHTVPVPTSIGDPLRSPSSKNKKSMKRAESAKALLHQAGEREVTGSRKGIIGTYEGNAGIGKAYVSPHIILN